jgi:hypothetical protein
MLALLRFFIVGIAVLLAQQSIAQDSTILKVHFLYGSKPKKKYKATEKKWFGGVLGGHAGVEVGGQKILHFLPVGKFHYLPKKNKHGRYDYNGYTNFYEILGGTLATNKRLVVSIPISAQQKQQFDSIVQSYTKQTPYDYAFAGYRCGSATYSCLGQLGIVPKYGKKSVALRIFYPRLLRKKILKLAAKNNWQLEQNEGAETRIWEKDRP